MAEREPGLSPDRERRSAAVSPGRLAFRRGAGTVVVLGLLGFFVWLGLTLTDGGGGRAAPATTAPPPPPRPLRIVFPEGFTTRDMAQRITAVNAIARRKRHVRPRLSARAYLRLAAAPRLVPAGFGRKPRNLEGFLFPATYDFTKRTTTRQLILSQLEAFRRDWSKVDLGYARTRNLTPYDVLIIASMVEKEALAPGERPKIAAVIYNRLKARMPLGIDATIRYALHVPGTQSLHESQLQSDTPYNTRKFPGLPPGPISNPGLASIRAAAHPARVDYLYFVRKPDKVHHFFTASYREFVNYANAHGF